ncbi:MAG: hypothetical protein ACPG4T_23245 [Nannocystaceae bacterium]
MAPLPRPILRFAVGTTLLAPAVGAGCDNDPPPTVNAPAPEQPKTVKPVESGDSGASLQKPPSLTKPEPKPESEPEPNPDLDPQAIEVSNTPQPNPEGSLNTKPGLPTKSKPTINTRRPKPKPKPKTKTAKPNDEPARPPPPT